MRKLHLSTLSVEIPGQQKECLPEMRSENESSRSSCSSRISVGSDQVDSSLPPRISNIIGAGIRSGEWTGLSLDRLARIVGLTQLVQTRDFATTVTLMSAGPNRLY
jgi:hypothetical protein